MTLLALLFNPAILGTLAVFLSILWMLKDQQDKTRPLLVFALVLNLFYGFLLNVVMGGEDGILPWKYDPVLLQLDHALGIQAAWIAAPLQGFWRVPLIVIYQLMVPMMIVWYFATRLRNRRGSVVLAYSAELFTGPLLYAILPACGPIYAYRAAWLHPPLEPAHTVRFSGMPNAFPSLHLATALVFVLFAQGRLWRSIALVFLVGTALATLATGEHYVIDLVPGLAFGCFAAAVGYRKARVALLYLALVLFWSIAVRFGDGFLIAHPNLLRLLAAVTVLLAIRAVFTAWRTSQSPAAARQFSPPA